MANIRETFGRNLKELMTERRLTGKEVAESIGVSPSSITHWIKGRELPSADNIDKIAIYLGIPLAALFTDDNLFEPRPTKDPGMNDLMKVLAKAVADEMKKFK